MSLRERYAVARIKQLYADTPGLWHLAIAEHWEQHNQLPELLDYVATLEVVYAER